MYIVNSNLLLLCYDYQSFKVVTEVPKWAFSDTFVSEYLWRVLNNWLPITKINFNLSEPHDKEGRPGDVTTTHMADKNNVSEKSDRPI